MKQRFEFLLKESDKTLAQIATKAGYTVDYIHRLKRESAKERFNEDTIKAFADALGVYPSEMLPLEWQKPSHEFDERLMREIIKGVAKIYEEQKENCGLDRDWMADMTLAAYKKYSGKASVNDNDVYEWMDGVIMGQQSK